MDLFGDLPPPTDKTKSKQPELYETISVNPKIPPAAEKRKPSCTGDTDELEAKKPKESGCKTCSYYSLKSFHAERKGEREEMQDALLLYDDCSNDFSSFHCGLTIERASFFAVFDGHGGSRCSTFVKENLFKFVTKNFPNEPVEKFDAELKKSLTKAFKETDEAFLTKASQETPSWRDGSTATSVLVLNNVLYISNIGDSKTILVRRTCEDGKPGGILPLTKDHSPLDFKERQRIQKAGGFVRDGRVQGVLEVSRALGDAKFKKFVPCTPDITKCTLTENDQYLLLACDGLWKGFSIQDAVSYINGILNDSTIEDEDQRYEKACGSVASEAIRRGSSDNVTVVLVRISL